MELRLKLNRMNPAEYYGSLGFLELLSQQDPALLSHFAGDGNLVTLVVVGNNLALPNLASLPVEALPFDDPYTAPILVNGFRLDWWLDAFKEQASSLKTWAGTTTPEAMLKNYQVLMAGVVQTQDMLGFSKMTMTKSTFNLDTRASRDPIRFGYSQKDAGERSVVYPFCEFLCAIGLQNFHPFGRDLEYYTWSRPVLTSIAHAACRQAIPGLQSKGFKAGFVKVSQGMREVSSVSEF